MVKLGAVTYSGKGKYVGVSGCMLMDMEALPPDFTAWEDLDDDCPYKPLWGDEDCGWWPVIYFKRQGETCFRAICYYQLQDNPMVAWPIDLELDSRYIGLLDSAEAEDATAGGCSAWRHLYSVTSGGGRNACYPTGKPWYQPAEEEDWQPVEDILDPETEGDLFASGVWAAVDTFETDVNMTPLSKVPDETNPRPSPSTRAAESRKPFDMFTPAFKDWGDDTASNNPLLYWDYYASRDWGAYPSQDRDEGGEASSSWNASSSRDWDAGWRAGWGASSSHEWRGSGWEPSDQ